jgi:hypothetical protein
MFLFIMTTCLDDVYSGLVYPSNQCAPLVPRMAAIARV